MIRIPEIKKQAQLMSAALATLGFDVPHQKALDIAAQMQGHKNWNVMRAALANEKPVESKESSQAPEVRISELVANVISAADAVVDQSDGCGCTDDLVVTSSEAVDDLREALQAYRETGNIVVIPQGAADISVGGFNQEDVRSVRPDLEDDEIDEVMAFLSKHFDASYGLNWDSLLANSLQCIPAYCAEAQLKHRDGRSEPVTVDLVQGTLYRGTLKDRGEPFTGFFESGTSVVFAPGIDFDLSDESAVLGGVQDELAGLCDDLRAAEIRFDHCSSKK